MPRFVVDLGDVKISKEKEQAIAHAVQRAVLAEIASLPPAGPVAIHIPRDWYGFILRQQIAALEAAEKQVGQQLGAMR